MAHVLLAVHVLAAIVLVGGSAVATSLFPRYAPVVPEADTGQRNRAVAVAMHRITGGYAVAGLLVPLFGIALAVVQGRMGEIWITISMVLTAAAAILVAARIHPLQRIALNEPDSGSRLRTLAMLSGVYNLIWAAVVVLMIVRPGSVTA